MNSESAGDPSADGDDEPRAITGAIPVAPSLDLAIDGAQTPDEPTLVSVRVVRSAVLAIGLGLCAAAIALVLTRLIALVTNLAFYGRLSVDSIGPAQNQLGLWVIAIPVIGGLIVGFMARYGSKAIRGHGIPEAMENVLTNRSRIPARITFLKPLSAAIAIGTGGPFGAEGPIIATGGALGSLWGQLLHTSAAERKTLLAAGAAAGMSATFGSPVSAVLLAVELLLFEFRARSLIPVAFAAVTAAGVRVAIEGSEAAFSMSAIAAASLSALAFYVLLGAAMGIAAILVTRLVYVIEDAFEYLPIHWMWWPAIGAVAVGVVGYFAPKTLGVGYDNISGILADDMTVWAVFVLCAMKLCSWSISLGSGTSGGTLAPLFTIGGGLGAVLGAGAIWLAPALGIDIRVAALVGMAAMFAGASRAVLTSAVFAFETTHQVHGLLPLLGGCTAAYLVSCLLMRNTIMTEKIARRGIRAPVEYAADALDQMLVSSAATSNVVALQAEDRVVEIRAWLQSEESGSSFGGYPVLDARRHLVGVLTRRELLSGDAAASLCIADLIHRSPKFVYDDCTVRQAADHMANHDIGRLPVMTRGEAPRIVGFISRSDIIGCFRQHLDENRPEPPTIRFPRLPGRRAASNRED